MVDYTSLLTWDRFLFQNSALNISFDKQKSSDTFINILNLHEIID